MTPGPQNPPVPRTEIGVRDPRSRTAEDESFDRLAAAHRALEVIRV